MWKIKHTIIIFLLIVLGQSSAYANPEVIINEIYYNSTGNDLEKEFIELYVWDDGNINIDISGWNVTTYDGNNETLPYIENLRNFTSIAIFMGSGTSDLNASDGNATIYLGRTTELLNDSAGQVGLYDRYNNLIDFVRYGGGSGQPALGNWDESDPGITAISSNKSIQLHGEDLNSSINWFSAQPSPAEPNIFEFLADPGNDLWYYIHNGLNYPIDLSSHVGTPGWNITNVSKPLNISEINNLTEFLNYTYNFMKDKGLGTPETGGDNIIDVKVTKNGTFGGAAGGADWGDAGTIYVDLGDMNDPEKRILNKKLVEHEQVHLIQYNNSGGTNYGDVSRYSDLEGMAEYWSTNITMKEFNITYENYINIYDNYYGDARTDWLGNTNRNFYDGFEAKWDWYWANHMFLRWLSGLYGEEKIRHIFHVRNVTITGMPDSVNKAFIEQGSSVRFADLFKNYSTWLYDNYRNNISVNWTGTLNDSTTNLTQNGTLNPWGFNVERIIINTSRPIAINFTGKEGVNYSITLIKILKNGTEDRETVDFAGSNTFIICNTYANITLIKRQINNVSATNYNLTVTRIDDITPPEVYFDHSKDDYGILYLKVSDLVNAKITVDGFQSTNVTKNYSINPSRKRVNYTRAKIDVSKPASYRITATDICKTTSACPIFFTLSREAGKTISHQFTLTNTENKFKIDNNGVTNIKIKINNDSFSLVAHPIKRGLEGDIYFIPEYGEYEFSISIYMVEGDNNVVLEALGKPGGSAEILISE